MPGLPARSISRGTFAKHWESLFSTEADEVLDAERQQYRNFSADVRTVRDDFVVRGCGKARGPGGEKRGSETLSFTGLDSSQRLPAWVVFGPRARRGGQKRWQCRR